MKKSLMMNRFPDVYKRQKKKLEKVTTGKVTVRQQTDIQKVASAFLAEDLATVKERIINDYAIPMLKNGIWSIFSSALSLMIFGEDKSRSQSSNYVRGSSNSYDRYYACLLYTSSRRELWRNLQLFIFFITHSPKRRCRILQRRKSKWCIWFTCLH